MLLSKKMWTTQGMMARLVRFLPHLTPIISRGELLRWSGPHRHISGRDAELLDPGTTSGPQPPLSRLWEKRNSFKEAIPQTLQVWSEKPQEAPLFKGAGNSCGTWYSGIHAAPPRTQFLFLEEPPFADCHAGNTQEALLAVTCFSKHWM